MFIHLKIPMDKIIFLNQKQIIREFLRNIIVSFEFIFEDFDSNRRFIHPINRIHLHLHLGVRQHHHPCHVLRKEMRKKMNVQENHLIFLNPFRNRFDSNINILMLIRNWFFFE